MPDEETMLHLGDVAWKTIHNLEQEGYDKHNIYCAFMYQISSEIDQEILDDTMLSDGDKHYNRMLQIIGNRMAYADNVLWRLDIGFYDKGSKNEKKFEKHLLNGIRNNR